MSAPFTIGASDWPGLAKVNEEASELGQVISMLIAFPHGTRPDGTDIIARLHEETADTLAAIRYSIAVNPNMDAEAIENRAAMKFRRFLDWDQAEKVKMALEKPPLGPMPFLPHHSHAEDEPCESWCAVQQWRRHLAGQR